MANLHDIKRRRESVKNTQKITRAMKMVAASKLRRAQDAIVQARPYALRMGELVNHLAARAELDGHPLLQQNDGTGTVELIIVTSDRGLCGGFNSSVTNAAKEHVKTTFKGRSVRLTTVGKKGTELLARHEGGLHRTYEHLLDGPLLDGARRVIDTSAQSFVAGDAAEVYCLYNQFKSAIAQEVTLERMLPFEPVEVEVEEGDEEPRELVDFLYEPSATELFESLLLRHLNVQMHRILNESSASEHGARMTAMEAATKNAGEMIDRLNLEYNRARQSAITTELIEVVSGAEAL